jgi:hypothetical protein
LAAARTT